MSWTFAAMNVVREPRQSQDWIYSGLSLTWKSKQNTSTKYCQTGMSRWRIFSRSLLRRESILPYSKFIFHLPTLYHWSNTKTHRKPFIRTNHRKYRLLAEILHIRFGTSCTTWCSHWKICMNKLATNRYMCINFYIFSCPIFPKIW